MKVLSVAVALSLPVIVSVAATSAAERAPSPAERRIAELRGLIERDPRRHQAWTELALALARRARETSDPSFYVQAEEALRTSLAVEPDDFEALKARAWVLLGQHEFSRARELAAALNKRAPDDVMVYGLLTDANVELGDYAAAERAAQWMLDLRPGNLAGLTRAAYLRELFGDVEGALELMTMALAQVPSAETEERAWVLTQVGHLERMRGRHDAAETALVLALEGFPDYHYALGELGRLRTDQKRHREAARLLVSRQQRAPHPENLYELAEAWSAAGERKRARSAFAEFEKAARREMDGADNANRELIFYYADHAGRPAEALRIARREMARRRDVHTLDAYAWALHVSGRHREARAQVEAALAVGTRDPGILRHARVIARRLAGRVRLVPRHSAPAAS